MRFEGGGSAADGALTRCAATSPTREWVVGQQCFSCPDDPLSILPPPNGLETAGERYRRERPNAGCFTAHDSHGRRMQVSPVRPKNGKRPNGGILRFPQNDIWRARVCAALPAISVFDKVNALREGRDTLPSRFSPLPTARDVRGASSEGTADGCKSRQCARNSPGIMMPGILLLLVCVVSFREQAPERPEAAGWELASPEVGGFRGRAAQWSRKTPKGLLE